VGQRVQRAAAIARVGIGFEIRIVTARVQQRREVALELRPKK
jgi:hypothetical protein